MVISLSPPLRARNGHVLRIIIVVRISTLHQDPRSLADQEAMCRVYIAQHYGGDVEVIVIASQGSGEHLDRDELRDLEDRIASQQFDVVIVEDLGRICRRKRAYDFCEMCQDCGARLISINDRVDTTVAGWEDSAFIATWHHERSNRDTSDRIRRSLNNRFDQGGVVQFVLYGYIKPEGAKSDADLLKDPAAEEIIPELFRRLEQGALYTELADWLNERGIPPGPCCRLPRWDGPMVRRVVHNRMLKGIRERNRLISKRHHKTGRHKSVKAMPQQLRVRPCPHLAYFEAAYFDRVVALADERNDACRRTNQGGPDPRQGVPRTRTQFPGQHARCGICGRLLHWHGMKGRKILLYSGAADYRCWNGLFINGEECSQRIVTAIVEAIADLPDFDTVFGDLVRQQSADFDGRQAAERAALEQKVRSNEQRLAHVMDNLERRPGSEALLHRLDELEREQSQLRHAQHELADQPALAVALPDAHRLREQAVHAIRAMVRDDQEAGRLLRQLVPDLYIVPYQVCDGSDILPRAEFTLTLVPLLPPALANSPEAAQVTRRLVVTLCPVSKPLQHHAAATELKAQGLRQHEIGQRLGMVRTAVQRSLRLHRLMLSQGLAEPLVRLTELPARTNRLRRHRHPRFRFEPLAGWTPPSE
ncbi:MAG TPA: recombinase family protein [Planctomycetaceae bacterium]|nr:recombinase family protein [Planctomycetaceae bacterium]